MINTADLVVGELLVWCYASAASMTIREYPDDETQWSESFALQQGDFLLVEGVGKTSYYSYATFRHLRTGHPCCLTGYVNQLFLKRLSALEQLAWAAE